MRPPVAGMPIRQSQAGLDKQSLAVLHQHTPYEAQLRSPPHRPAICGHDQPGQDHVRKHGVVIYWQDYRCSHSVEIKPTRGHIVHIFRKKLA